MAVEDPRGRETCEEQGLAQLERQVERGSLFTHTVVSRNADQIYEAQSFLYAVIDILIEKGIVTHDEVLQSVGKVRQEMEEKGETIGPGIALRIEGEDIKQDDFVAVNCSERLHICKESTACCHHLDPNTGGCSIYENRPGVCRRYSCARDERIWKDFEKMELNEEWIHDNLTESRPRLARALMIRQDLLPRTKASLNE